MPALTLLLAATTARAEVWTWTDKKGEAHYTDDPSTIPQVDRKAAHPMSGEAGTLNVIHRDAETPDPEDVRGPATDDADRLQKRHTDLEAEVAELKHQLANAERELRKYSAGGRVGAADAAARAKAVVEDLQKQVKQRQADLAVVEDQQKQLEHVDDTAP